MIDTSLLDNYKKSAETSKTIKLDSIELVKLVEELEWLQDRVSHLENEIMELECEFAGEDW